MAARTDFTGKGPVIFEEVELPVAVKGFHLVPFWNDLDDDLCDWLFDLHYCWGRTREAPSRDILRYVRVVRRKLAESPLESVHRRICEEHPECDEPGAQETINDWNKALDLMEQAAQGTKTCRWSVAATDESLEKNLKIAIAMLRGNVKFPDGTKLSPLYDPSKPGVEFKVRNLTRDQQIALLITLSDGLSDKRPGPVRRFLRRITRLFKS